MGQKSVLNAETLKKNKKLLLLKFIFTEKMVRNKFEK